VKPRTSDHNVGLFARFGQRVLDHETPENLGGNGVVLELNWSSDSGGQSIKVDGCLYYRVTTVPHITRGWWLGEVKQCRSSYSDDSVDGLALIDPKLSPRRLSL
jgi:hypothetical protein